MRNKDNYAEAEAILRDLVEAAGDCDRWEKVPIFRGDKIMVCIDRARKLLLKDHSDGHSADLVVDEVGELPRILWTVEGSGPFEMDHIPTPGELFQGRRIISSKVRWRGKQERAVDLELEPDEKS